MRIKVNIGDKVDVVNKAGVVISTGHVVEDIYPKQMSVPEVTAKITGKFYAIPVKALRPTAGGKS